MANGPPMPKDNPDTVFFHTPGYQAQNIIPAFRRRELRLPSCGYKKEKTIDEFKEIALKFPINRLIRLSPCGIISHKKYIWAPYDLLRPVELRCYWAVCSEMREYYIKEYTKVHIYC